MRPRRKQSARVVQRLAFHDCDAGKSSVSMSIRLTLADVLFSPFRAKTVVHNITMMSIDGACPAMASADCMRDRCSSMGENGRSEHVDYGREYGFM